jgi:glycosyltransferase involved in cell wall biosynthesis
VTVLTARFWPERYGGVEERIWNVSKALARRGCHIEVLTENRLGIAAEEDVAPGVHVVRFPPYKPDFLWRLLYLSQALWWRRVLKQRPPAGLIWATDPTTAFAAILLGYGSRLVFNPADCSGGIAHIQRVYPHITTLDVNWLLVTLDRAAYRFAKYMMVSSENVKYQYARFYRRERLVQVSPHGVELPSERPTREAARARFGLPLTGFVIGFVGRLDPCKGIEYLLEAIRTANLGDDDRVLLIGAGPDERRLRDMAERLGVNRHIVWAGRVNEPGNVYAAIDVFVLPSVFEAFGLVLIEAMAAGVPVLARAADRERVFTAATEIIANGVTGFVTDSHAPADLAVKLRWLSEHPTERSRMGAAARELAGRRNWDVLADEYLRAVPELRSPVGDPVP